MPRPLPLALLLVAGVQGFYLPGVAVHEYAQDERVDIKVNKLTSTKTQLPYDYYSLPFCKPESVINAVENLGEVLHGSVITNSAYEIYMGKSDFRVLCRLELTKKTAELLAKRIKEDYRVHLIMDNLPAATKMIREMPDGKTITMYDRGYPLGFVGSAERPGSTAGVAYLYNHLRFVIKFHREDSFEGSRIVGFEVEPLSVKHQYKGPFTTDISKLNLLTVPVGPDLPPQPVAFNPGPATENELVFSYDVKWEFSDIRWASRWDLYLYMGDDQIHWFSIINSLAIVLLLTGIVAMIMMRTLRRDFNRYNEQDKEDLQEESGWKLVHADVFRPPPNAIFLCASLGTGMQLLSMSVICIFCAMLGFLSPANRGGLLTATLLLFVLMGVPAGYYASHTYKSLRGVEWKTTTILTAMLYPGLIAATFFVLNFFIWGQGSSGAIPFTTMFVLLLMWFGISTPLVFVGAFFGFKAPVKDTPVRTNEIPRQIPLQAWYMGGAFNVLMGGILPFGAIFIELFFIMTSVWLQRFYYVFGFLALVLLILLITCAEISIVLCYFQLCNEDYHWWWRSFLTAGSSGLYLFAYSIMYFFTQLDIIGFVPTLIYFTYMLVFATLFFLITGTIGFYSCHWFVWTIYSAIKVD
jgi:transmembrane 9 superfamily protein 2/4